MNDSATPQLLIVMVAATAAAALLIIGFLIVSQWWLLPVALGAVATCTALVIGAIVKALGDTGD